MRININKLECKSRLTDKSGQNFGININKLECKFCRKE